MTKTIETLKEILAELEVQITELSESKRFKVTEASQLDLSSQRIGLLTAQLIIHQKIQKLIEEN